MSRMPAFTPQAIRPYFDEVQYQIEAFMGALREIKPPEQKGLPRHERLQRHALLFRNTQAMVTAAAQLSKLFWVPVPSQELTKRESEILEFGLARSELLRRIFQVDDHSPLKKRDVRNAYEHLDHRLDRTLSKSEPTVIIDRGIGPANAFSGAQNKLIKRFLDPQSSVLTVMNTEVHMPPLIKEVERLERLIISMTLSGFNPADEPNHHS